MHLTLPICLVTLPTVRNARKNGWTGDAQINIETGLYNYDAITIYEKWMADHRDETTAKTAFFRQLFPPTVGAIPGQTAPDWTSTIAIIPWNIYLFYGDTKVLEDCYENIRLYVDHIRRVVPFRNYRLGAGRLGSGKIESAQRILPLLPIILWMPLFWLKQLRF